MAALSFDIKILFLQLSIKQAYLSYIEIDVSMTGDEIEECKRAARKQIENTLGGFSLDELNIPGDEESEEEFEYLPAYL